MIKELEVLKTIKEITSIKEKINYLSLYKDNSLIHEILKVAFSPFIKTNIAEKKIDKNIKNNSDFGRIEFNNNIPDASIFNLLNYVSSDICTGKDADILAIRDFILHYDVEEQSLLKQIITKKLSIGMNIKNINKAFPNFITVVSPMLAFDYHKYETLDREYAVTLKLDGNRLLVKNETDKISAFSRNGLEEKNLGKFLQLLDLPIGYYYDGELLPSKSFNKALDGFIQINSILRKKEEVKPSDLIFNIFDMIPIDQFESDNCDETYLERRKNMEQIKNTDYQVVIPILKMCKINSELFDLLKDVVSEGHEGLMLNWIEGKYECKRSKNLLKMKLFKEADLRCIGINEGRGKYKGTLGSIDVLYKGNIVSIPSFPDELRNYYWNNPNGIVGKIVTVKYFEESRNKDGNISLRLPSFKIVRDDKDIESYE